MKRPPKYVAMFENWQETLQTLVEGLPPKLQKQFKDVVETKAEAFIADVCIVRRTFRDV